MLPIMNLDNLRRFRDDLIEEKRIKNASGQIQLNISMNSSSIAAGARQTLKEILAEIESNNISNIKVIQSGGLGLDASEPTIQIVIGNQPGMTYGKVTPEIVKRIIKEHILGGKPVKSHIIQNLN